jgi:excisionase family DNA binding protein
MTSGHDNSHAAERLTFTVEEAANLLGISRNTAYEAVRRGEIPIIRIGRRILIPRNRLEAMVNQVGVQP